MIGGRKGSQDRMSKNVKEDKDVMEGCPVPVPTIDEGELLGTIRSPRFFEACKKLRIDPIDLKPRTFDSVISYPSLLLPYAHSPFCSFLCRASRSQHRTRFLFLADTGSPYFPFFLSKIVSKAAYCAFCPVQAER